MYLIQSSLETKEYMVHELPQVLDVPQDRLCLMAALLGGTILSEQSLVDFYKRLGITQKKVCVWYKYTGFICFYILSFRYLAIGYLKLSHYQKFSASSSRRFGESHLSICAWITILWCGCRMHRCLWWP